MQSKFLLAFILVGALAWRLVLWAQPLHAPANDEIEYLQVARDLLAGRGWSFYEQWRWLRAPLYPLWLAGSLWLADGDLHRAALPNLALSVVLVGLIYRLTRALTPTATRRPALLAAALAAALQTYATFASLYMSETLFSTLFTAGLLSLAAWRRRGRLRYIALAGCCLGLACLTRSAAQVFLPLVALWLLWWQIRFQAQKNILRLLMPPLVLAATFVAVISPWTLRNCRAYGSCILIETGGAYNLWAFYEPRESLETIHQVLEAIPNPVDRAAEARMRGMARLREDPLMLVRRIPAQWNNLWVVKPIQDRFLLPNDYSDPPPTFFMTALLLDDLLYLVILCAAPFGLLVALRQRDGFALLLALWVVAFSAAGVLTHTEGRYRHFFFMILIALAGLALDALLRTIRMNVRHPAEGYGRTDKSCVAANECKRTQRIATSSPPLPPRGRGAGGEGHPWHPNHLPVALSFITLATTALLLALLPALSYYPWDWAQRGVMRSFYRELGDRHAAAGRTTEAAAAYERAVMADATPDGWLALGDLARRTGDLEAAERFYRSAHAERPPYVAPSASLGDLLRELGRNDEAQHAFQGVYLREQQMLDWSYQMLDPAPRTQLDVGSGLDFGYVGGFYPAEALAGLTSRWSNGRAALRLSATTSSDPLVLRMHLAAPRPNGTPVPLSLCRADHCTHLILSGEWRVVQILIPNGPDAIELHSPTFAAPDRRDLGVLLDWAEVGR
ncbi:MAG: hypothetical protein EI684_06760 [Candidatus Viridilinea halotolerans]|uniref:Glycosyltransferase RgtA/B/C/D-like domain-containing protein n=1 Tax=Candidatus Viridilinea halotolerans TaxID=2491704 RepID=A0A426U3Z3_9CHLR|nr:MAG: hypothetical protein EI684_06760 [Candidatus Viridilinea halotolerans]